MDNFNDSEGPNSFSSTVPGKSSGFPTELITEPQEKLSLSRLASHLLHVEAKDVTLKWVFDHVRNYVISGVALWAGINAFQIPKTTYIDVFAQSIGGITLILSAFVLFALNVVHGIAGFSKIRKLSSVNKISYLVCAFLVLCAGQILFITAKSF